MKHKRGFTLIEAVISLALFTVLSIGAFQVWRYASKNTVRLTEKTNALESARAAVDALVINLQLADEITLVTEDNGSLKRLELRELDTSNGKPVNKKYVFTFDSSVKPQETRYHRLEFGGNNEFASHLAEIKLIRNPEKEMILIKVKTDGLSAMTFETAVDMRHKVFL